MTTEIAHAFVNHLAKLLELARVGIIIVGVALAAAIFVRSGLRGGGWPEAYQACRSNLGRGILLGLERGQTVSRLLTRRVGTANVSADDRDVIVNSRRLASAFGFHTTAERSAACVAACTTFYPLLPKAKGK